MSAPRLVAFLLVAGLLGAAVGYGIAWRMLAPPPPRSVRSEVPAGSLAAAVQAALTNPDRLRGVAELSDLLASSGPEQLDEIRSGFDSVFVDVAELEVVLLAEWWTAFDPKAAFAWTQDSRVANQAMVIRSVIRAWARRDPIGARDALGTILDPVTQRASLDGLVAGWDESGEPGLAEYLRSQPLSIEQLLSITTLARRRVLSSGPEAAFAWAEAQPEDGPEDASRFKLQLFRRIASEASLVDLERTGEWAARHANGPNGDGLLGRVGLTWSMRDGAGAMAWLASLPPSPARDSGSDETFRAWFQWHPQEAREWFEKQPADALPGPLVATYAVSIATQDPQLAIRAVPRISDPEQREMVTVTVARIWRQSDPQSAEAWVDMAELSPRAREQIMAPLQPGAAHPAPDLDAVEREQRRRAPTPSNQR